ncbi:MAG: hydrolase [Acidobacteria bacterium]|nr:hydrolase [Acidobacteriota bacterium]
MSRFRLIEAGEIPDSPARTRDAEREPVRVGAVQGRWYPDPDEHRAALAEGIEMAAGAGAQLVCLQELTLLPYCAWERREEAQLELAPESIEDGPSVTFAREMASATGAAIHISLYEDSEEATGGRGFNTAVVVLPSGEMAIRNRKLHIPISAGYYEDTWFDAGPPVDPTPLLKLDGARFGFPTCWDQWFPELARLYSLAGADVIVYPTAIGSEPDFPGFDTEPLWQTVITANGITAGTFMVAINRVGREGPLVFYGSSFISDPYGRVLVQAGRDEQAVLVADLDVDQRRDWLELFPFPETRRPDAYGKLVG